jgi:hypothetical protein
MLFRALLAAAACLVALGGCDSFPDSFLCSTDGQCVRGSERGVCRAGACAFDDPGCASELRYDRTAGGGNAGLCVPPIGPRDSGVGDSGGLLNDCGGTGTLPGRVLDACGVCLLGRYQCDGPNELRCVGEPTEELIVTSEGYVEASTTFSGFPANLSVDGDLTTSWFSSGPEADGVATRYDWTLPSADCVIGISIFGNALHDNKSFQTDYGFEEVTVQVLDAADGVQFSEARSLSGTPDPEQNIELAAYGRTVRLLFSNHESTDCGGFSELVVTVVR